MKVLAQFVKAATDPAQFPASDAPEIAFLGRSNVGKSSVINSLLGAKIAKTSSTPGRTRTINFYDVRWPGRPKPDVRFVDLPGYGYAKLPREITVDWPKFIEPYLEYRPNLMLAIVLVDSKVPPQPSDKQLISWLGAKQRQFLVVATKADRISGNALTGTLQALRDEHGIDRIVRFSARTGEGHEALWAEIRRVSQTEAA